LYDQDLRPGWTNRYGSSSRVYLLCKQEALNSNSNPTKKKKKKKKLLASVIYLIVGITTKDGITDPMLWVLV
jgi:hypothetical protein